MIKKRFFFSPYFLILISFLLMILIGGTLLSMPISTSNGEKIKWIDGIFMATSALCVTGLSVKDLATDYNIIGKTILLILIQIGALGVITISSFFILIFSKKIGYKTKKIIQEEGNIESLFNIQVFLKKVIFIVFITELLGAILLFFEFIQKFRFTKALYYSIFHSISAFSNAGFSLFSDNLVSFKGSWIVNITISMLVILGGLGFAVIMNIYNYYITKKDKRILLTTKISIKYSVVLLIVGTIMTFIFEYTNKDTLLNLNFIEKIGASFFQSMTTRTAGFNTISISGLRESTALLYVFLMFIGASPGSTGGGIKTTTIGVLFLGLKSILGGLEDVEIGAKRISWELFYKAIAIVVMSILYISLILFLLVIIENKQNFFDLLFEVVSAYGTVGLSRDLTPLLHDSSKILLVLTMFIGRVGSLTIALFLSENLIKTKKYKYPEENILIG